MNNTEGNTIMLILTRQLQQAITIGDDITITVVGVAGSQVRLGIDAPKEVAVLREELYQGKQASTQADE